MTHDRDVWPPPSTLGPPAHLRPWRRSITRLAHGVLATRILALLALPGLFAVCAIDPPLAAETHRTGSTDRSTEAELSEALASHPEPARRAALLIAGDPEALLEVDRVQQESARRFAELIAPYSRRERKDIWNLVRYPGLVAALARDGRKTRAQLEAIADRFPPEEREAILEAGSERYALWVEIYGLELETRQRARRALSSADPPLQAAFDELENHPELMSLLLENIRWTTRLGSEYRDDPAGVAQRFATLEPELETRRREDERAWAEELADPASAEELERAARAFAATFGLESDDPEGPRDARAEQVTIEDGGRRSRTLRNTARIHHAYPYWFGYPDWYAVPLWTPLALSDHVGFRRAHGPGPRRRFVRVGLPSAFFLSWYHDVYRSGGRPISEPGVRYYDDHRPRHRRPRAPSAGIMREAEKHRSRSPGDDENPRDRGRRTSTSGDSSGRAAGRGSRADATTPPRDDRADRP